MASNKRELVLYKGRECFIYKYKTGDEEMVLCSIIEQWKDPEISIDELDVIMATFKLKESLIIQAS